MRPLYGTTCAGLSQTSGDDMLPARSSPAPAPLPPLPLLPLVLFLASSQDLCGHPPCAEGPKKCRKDLHEAARVLVGTTAITSASNLRFWLRLCHVDHTEEARVLLNQVDQAEARMAGAALADYFHEFNAASFRQVGAVATLTVCDERHFLSLICVTGVTFCPCPRLRDSVTCGPVYYLIRRCTVAVSGLLSHAPPPAHTLSPASSLHLSPHPPAHSPVYTCPPCPLPPSLSVPLSKESNS